MKKLDYIGLTVKIAKIKSRMRIFNRSWIRNPRWEINPYREDFDVDTLYDLIKADLVEKVEV